MKKTYILFLAASLTMAVGSCKKGGLFEVDQSTVDPNAVSEDVVLANPSKKQMIDLCKGLESAMRNGYNDFIASSSTVGREVMSSRSTDNRYYTELLGTNVAQYPGATAGANDPAGIFNGYYTAFSATRRRAELLVRTAGNATSITAGEKKAVEGFARTIQAFVTLNLLNMQGANGIRETFSDLNAPGDLLKPGKFGTYASGLTLVKKYADDGLAALNAATSFPFTFSSGFAGFNTVATFKQFNRAVAARIALYQNDWAGVLSNLGASFMNLAGSLTAGPKNVWSTAPNDFTNVLFQTANNNGQPYVVFNEVIAAVEAGDTRFTGASAKAQARTTPRSSGVFTSTHEVRMFTSNTSISSMLKNEELILMYAEANAETNTVASLNDAVNAINIIRTAYGLPAYSGAVTKAALIDEAYKQRRFSLFFEGHRWFDMRRRNLLAQIQPQGTIGSQTFVVFQRMSRPDAEVQWDLQNP
ncbi:MAG: RagB/SusD family nutrient uptake outer membrane protein [Dinghuibacter sp.]|nr:RagB/SusD family nutrient uptake outer membrane protein [Dinghuibacter sp.]